MKKKNLFLSALLVCAFVLAVGYFSAQKKSEPVYQSKIDQIMFDRKNKSPKYVITLTDRDKIELVDQIINKPRLSEETKEDAFSLQKILDNVPNMAKLTPIADLPPMARITNDPSMIESFDDFKLPKISSNGNKPWIEYSGKVVVPPSFHRVAIIINNAGLDTNLTSLAIKGLPKNVSFAFSPYAQKLSEGIKEARRSGHETYVNLLLPSKNFMTEDSGPLSLNLKGGIEENIFKTRKTISTEAPISGVVVNKGSVEEENEHTVFTKVLDEIRSRGLLMIDATGDLAMEKIKTGGFPRQLADIVIDENFDIDNINRQIADAEQIAHNDDFVLMVVEPKPVVLLAIRKWVDSFDPPIDTESAVAADLRADHDNYDGKPFVLVPASMIVTEE